ncbi:MFS transporter [Streptomyces sp. NPDC003444]
MNRRRGLAGSAVRRVPAHAVQSLTVRNFRLFAAGQLVSVCGTWMMVVAQDWLVLSLTGDSATALGVVTALQFAPVLLLTLAAGGLADRYDKRTLLMAANAVSGVLALLLAVLDLSGVVALWHVYVFALCLGVVNALEVPARMSFVSELVGPELLPNASALSAAYFNCARVAGPALAGLLIGVAGTGWTMLLNAVSYLATVAALALMRPAELHRARRGRGPGRARVADGLRHLLQRQDLVRPMVLVAVLGLFGFTFQLTLPLLARTVFHADAAAFGLLTTAFAAGSLAAAVVTALRRGRPPFGLVAGAAGAFGVLELLAGLAPDYATAVGLLFCTGFAAILFAQAANHRIQLGTDPAYRGRVMALYTLVFQGTTPLGALAVGALSERFGVRAAVVAGGAVSALTALLVLVKRPGGHDDAHHPRNGKRRQRPAAPAPQDGGRPSARPHP